MSAIGGLQSIFGNLWVPKGYPEIIKSPGTENQGIITTYFALDGADGLQSA